MEKTTKPGSYDQEGRYNPTDKELNKTLLIVIAIAILAVLGH
jgi:hypothetical protein